MGKSYKPYLQIKEKLELDILTGVYEPGGKLPSLKALAKHYNVNANTVGKSCVLLRKCNLIHKKRNGSYFVTSEIDAISTKRIERTAVLIESFLLKILSYGFSKKEIIDLIETFAENTEN